MALSLTGNPITDAIKNINTQVSRCRKYKGFYPSFTPGISYMSITNSVAGEYSYVAINGTNFLPNGTTYVNFGGYKNIPVTYGSSFNIAFVVPSKALSGSYNVVVVNNYTDNFSPAVNQSYQGTLNYSNPIVYTLT
jgi:uncharacterized protein (TIGR03437 family)